MSNIAIYLWLVWWAAWLAVGLSARKTVAREQFSHRLPHLLPLVLGMAVILTSATLPEKFSLGLSDSHARAAGLAGTVAGLAFACWARVHLGRNWSGLVAIKEGHELIRTGPYRILRHPIYTGLLTAAVWTAISINAWPALVGAGLTIVAAVIKLRHEEKFLRASFGRLYVQLCDAVPDRLIPTVY